MEEIIKNLQASPFASVLVGAAVVAFVLMFFTKKQMPMRLYSVIGMGLLAVSFGIAYVEKERLSFAQAFLPILLSFATGLNFQRYTELKAKDQTA